MALGEGGVNIILPRFYRRQCEAEDRRKLDQIIEESATIETAPRATLPGDTRRLRGIPVCAMGVRGTAPGTDPLAELLRSVR